MGYEAGRQDRAALKLAVYVSMGLGFCMMMFLVGAYIGIPKAIIGLYMNVHSASTQVTVHYAIQFLWLAGIVQLTDCFRLIAIGALRGIKDTKASMVISFIAFWLIAFPAGYLLAFVFHQGAIGIWEGLVIGLAITAILLVLRFHYLVGRVDLASLVTRSIESH